MPQTASSRYMEESDFESEDDFLEEISEDEFDFENEGRRVPAKSSSTTTTKKPSSSSSSSSSKNKSVLKEVSNEPVSKKSSSGTKKKTVEEIYQKKSQLEHILLRPDTYVGSVQPQEDVSMFVYDESEKKIVSKNITYTPGLFKIFDEILVNAADNAQRDSTMDRLEVEIDPGNNRISVKNNGKGIPIKMHKEEDMYVPTLIFGHLLTSSNYDDNEKKTTGGRNGYGAKLTNIFSKSFALTCADTESGLYFEQVWTGNMNSCGEAKVRKLKAAEAKKGDFVQITFEPDLEKFHMSELDEDTVALLKKRVFDVAGTMSGLRGTDGKTKKVSVYLNGDKIATNDFKKYIGLYDSNLLAYEKSDRWEIAISCNTDGQFTNISFVNAICTYKGGTHVDYISQQVTKHLSTALSKKNKGSVAIKPAQVKNHLTIFVNCLIENPSFDSQTKENMTLKASKFGSTFEIPEKTLKSLEKKELGELILSFAKIKQQADMKRISGKKSGRLTGMPKLEDANKAGSAQSKNCTLILTEGDSAKSLAMSGLSVIGRDFYGVFPLKGKPLNVRDASHAAIMKNEEIKSLIDIIGLKVGETYTEENIKSLRYGHVMIMADQDHDGSHIKGLIINFFHHYWPSLLNIPDFLQCFITPIVKVWKKGTDKKKAVPFFTIPEFEQWKKEIEEDEREHLKNYHIKYYKGLGTSSSEEAKIYFGDLEKHEIHFDVLESDIIDDESDDDDMTDSDEVKVGSSGEELIQVAFAKNKIEKRKQWLNGFRENTFIDYTSGSISYSSFINKELILFSRADNIRSIPNVFDGFKPSQRKVLFACFKKKLTSEMKVAQLAGYIGEVAAYHHGEASLTGTIVGMAQNFVGSNNINLLMPEGMFGTRRVGGKDAASARYIQTCLEKITRCIFHPDDDALLTYLEDDGLLVEPEYYLPVIPMVLVNGSDGIGTGWSTNIPNYNPREVIANVRRLIKNEDLVPMKPWFDGYSGDIVEKSGERNKGSFIHSGKIERIDDTTLVITELPLKKWTFDYKVFLDSMQQKKKDGTEDIKEFSEYHTDTTVNFKITAKKEDIDLWEREKGGGLYSKFKLTGSLSTSNLTLFDADHKIVQYSSPEDILQYFFEPRLELYNKRKEHLLAELKKDELKLKNQVRFVTAVVNEELVIHKKARKQLFAELQAEKYDLIGKNGSVTTVNDVTDEDELVEDSEPDADLIKGYDYLLGMKLWSLTEEKISQLKEKLAAKTQEVVELEATPVTTLWENDLQAIEDMLDERDEEAEKRKREEVVLAKKGSKKNARKTKQAAKKKKKKGEWDSDASSDEEDDEKDFADYKPKKRTIKRPVTTTKKSVLKTADSKKVAPPKNKPTAKIAKAVPAVEIVDEKEIADDSSVEMLSLADRLKKKVHVSPQPKTKSHGKKRINLGVDSEDDEDDIFGDIKSRSSSMGSAGSKKARQGPSPKKAAPKKSTSKSSKTNKVIDDDDFEDDSSVEVITSARAPSSRSTRGTNKGKKTTYTIDIDSEEEIGYADEESDDDFEFDD